jgi:hypothetical protein
MPTAVGLSAKLAGVFLAGTGVLLGVFAVFLSLSRKRSGLGFAVISILVCGSALYTGVLLAGGWDELLKAVQDRAEKVLSAVSRTGPHQDQWQSVVGWNGVGGADSAGQDRLVHRGATG